MLPIVHLLVIVVIVLLMVGLCWHLLNTLSIDARIKTVINVILVIALILWLWEYLLPAVLSAIR